MMRLSRLVLGGLLVCLCGCGNEVVEVEIGYKGKARVNPWLAAERFAQRYEFDVESLAAWRAPTADDAVWFVPASILNNASFIRRVEEWVEAGGHLVVLMEHAGAESSDWRSFEPELPVAKVLSEMLQRLGLEVKSTAPDNSAPLSADSP